MSSVRGGRYSIEVYLGFNGVLNHRCSRFAPPGIDHFSRAAHLLEDFEVHVPQYLGPERR
jgi:hypothetical protein